MQGVSFVNRRLLTAQASGLVQVGGSPHLRGQAPPLNLHRLHWSLAMTEETTRAQKAQCYRFGAFEANAATGELRRRGLRVKLNTQPFQLLLILLNRPGELVTREEIQRELWPDGTFVDFEHGVNSAVNRLREALGDKAGNPRFVETLARRGYRFIAPVERVNLQKDSPHNEPRDDEGRVPG